MLRRIYPILGAAAAVASSGQACSEPAGGTDVSIGIVDVGSNSISPRDLGDGVKVVDLTPPLQPGERSAYLKMGSGDHGTAVAQTFVKQYRKLDPETQITVYTVNPFVVRGGCEDDILSRAILQEGLKRLQATNVRVVISAFGVADQARGESVAKEFKDHNLILFAAAPNEANDPGIWPAASSSAIAVADGMPRQPAVFSNRSWSKWVDFVADGDYKWGNNIASGSSFSTPKVAAFGVYALKQNPRLDFDGLKAALAEFADVHPSHGHDFVKIGGAEMERRFVSSFDPYSQKVELAVDNVRANVRGQEGEWASENSSIALVLNPSSEEFDASVSGKKTGLTYFLDKNWPGNFEELQPGDRIRLVENSDLSGHSADVIVKRIKEIDFGAMSADALKEWSALEGVHPSGAADMIRSGARGVQIEYALAPSAELAKGIDIGLSGERRARRFRAEFAGSPAGYESKDSLASLVQSGDIQPVQASKARADSIGM